MTKEELQSQIDAACPQCKVGSPLRWRPETSEWVHDHIRTNNELRSTSFSHVYCLATPLRVEHQDILNG